MKKLLYAFVVTFSCFTINAQLNIDYGIKAGLNYNSNGNLFITGTLAGLNEKVANESDFGYQLGFYTQVNFTKFYVRPELIFVQTKSTFKNIISPSSEFKLSTLELPVLIGYSIIKPLHIYIGPSFQYIIDNKFSPTFDLNVESDITLKFNIGVDIQINKFAVDLRYTSGFSENFASFFDAVPTDGAGYAIDTRSNQVLLSVSYQLN